MPSARFKEDFSVEDFKAETLTPSQARSMLRGPARDLQLGRDTEVFYRKGDGTGQWRTLRPREFFRGVNGELYIRAFCHLRGEERTFRADRVCVVSPGSAASHAGSTAPGTPNGRSGRADTATSGHTPSRTGAEAGTSTRAGSDGTAAAAQHSQKRESNAGFRVRAAFAWLSVGLVLALVLDLPESDGGGAEAMYDPDDAARAKEYIASLSAGAAAGKAGGADGSETSGGESGSSGQSGKQPAPRVVRTLTYNGRDIDVLAAEDGRTYRVKALNREGPRFESLQAARVAVNARRFIARTGIDDSELLAMYAGADANSNGKLGWDELQRFQGRLDRAFRYRNNDTALAPG